MNESTRDTRQSTGRPWHLVLGYAAMIVVSLGLYLLIRGYGETLPAPAPVSNGLQAVAAAAGHSNTFLHVLIALTAIILLGQILRRVFAFFSQPPVIGEMVAGILLGPSLLGPELSAHVLPPTVAPFLGVIAQLGVVLYMFLVGLELNPAVLRQKAHATIAISHASILTPFLLGATLALLLYPRLSTSDVGFTSFALFMGVAMSITAFPVLARILTDYGMSRTRLGVVALSCAAVDDVTAWCLLAFVVGVVQAQPGEGFMVATWALAYIGFMLLLARPLLEWIVRSQGRDTASPEEPTRGQVTAIFIALLFSSLLAEGIGIHAIFGAFMLGAVIPHDSPAARALTRQLESLVTVLLLPAFFAFTGMRTRIDLLSDPGLWSVCALIILIATLGKFGGSFVAARLTGMSTRNAAILGILMNSRGLMELIVLNVGLDLGVISPTLFSLMVLMALFTTGLTSPVLRWLKAPAVSRAETDEELPVPAGKASLV